MIEKGRMVSVGCGGWLASFFIGGTVFDIKNLSADIQSGSIPRQG